MSEAQEAYDKALDRLRRLGGTDPLSMRRGAEADYAQAHDKLVAEGRSYKLRDKYRGR